MSLIRGLFAVQGADIRNPSVFLPNSFIGRKTTSGENVNATSALTFSAYFNALRVISEDIGKLPFLLFKRLKPRGKIKAITNPIFQLLQGSPNPDMSTMSFRETLTGHALSWGGGVAEIVRNGRGRAVQMWPIHPSRVTIRRDDDQNLFYEIRVHKSDFSLTRRPEVMTGDMVVRLPARDVFHIHGFGDNGISGYSVINFASESFGLGLATQRFGASFFGHGTTLSGVLEHPNQIGTEAADNLRKSWNKMYRGSDNAHKIGILEEGMTFKPISVSPEEAQFLETRNFQVEEVARWFRIPPHKIQHLAKATFSNIEQQSQEYVTDTLMPWSVRWEHEVMRKLLITEPDDLFAKIIFNALLRGDSAARSNFYTKQFAVGGLSSNDIRDLEDDNPVEGGDQYFVPANFKTLKAASMEVPDSQPSRFGATLEDHRIIFEDAAERIANKEMKAITRAINKYTNENDFNSWVDKFYGEQKTFFSECFSPAVKLFSNKVNENGNLLIVLEDFVSDYITIAKIKSMEFFKNKNASIDNVEIVNHLFKNILNSLEVENATSD